MGRKGKKTGVKRKGPASRVVTWPPPLEDFLNYLNVNLSNNRIGMTDNRNNCS